MVKNRGGENGMIFPGGKNGISPNFIKSRKILDDCAFIGLILIGLIYKIKKVSKLTVMRLINMIH